MIIRVILIYIDMQQEREREWKKKERENKLREGERVSVGGERDIARGCWSWFSVITCSIVDAQWTPYIKTGERESLVCGEAWLWWGVEKTGWCERPASVVSGCQAPAARLATAATWPLRHHDREGEKRGKRLVLWETGKDHGAAAAATPKHTQ